MTEPEPSRRTFTHLRSFDELGSTNTWLLEAAELGGPGGDRRRGRPPVGRAGPARPEVGVRGIDRPVDLDSSSAPTCQRMSSSASRRWCRWPPGTQLRRWRASRSGSSGPNDLVVDDQKLAGLLAEGRGLGTTGVAVVVGIGINISWPMPGEADGLRATCLNVVADRAVEREALLESMLDSIELRRPDLDDPDQRKRLVHELAARTVTIGRRVRVELANETFSGVAMELDPGEGWRSTPRAAAGPSPLAMSCISAETLAHTKSNTRLVCLQDEIGADRRAASRGPAQRA